jgi:hypothetical protein
MGMIEHSAAELANAPFVMGFILLAIALAYAISFVVSLIQRRNGTLHESFFREVREFAEAYDECKNKEDECKNKGNEHEDNR